MFCLKQHIADGMLLRRIAVGQLATDHEANDLVHCQFGGGAGCHPGAVAHDGDFIRNAEDLLHLVRDVNDPAALCPQHVDDAEEMLDFLLGERGGRLIKYDHLGVVRHRLGDLDHLPLRNRHFAHNGLRIDIQPEFFEQLLGRGIHLLLACQRNAGGDLRESAQPHIVHDIALQRLIQLLMHHGNAVFQCLLGVCKVDFPAIQVHMSAVLGIHAEQALHQRRFAGAVLPHQGMDGACFHGQRNIVQRLDAGKRLVDILHAQKHICLCLRLICSLFHSNHLTQSFVKGAEDRPFYPFGRERTPICLLPISSRPYKLRKEC